MDLHTYQLKTTSLGPVHGPTLHSLIGNGFVQETDRSATRLDSETWFNYNSLLQLREKLKN